MLAARISLTLSRHSSLSFIALGRSSGQQPVSSHSCWMYVCAGRPAFARPCVGIHKSTSLMSSSLLLQQCPACLVRLTWIVFVIGGRWPYSWCLVGCCCQDLCTEIHGFLSWPLPASQYAYVWAQCYCCSNEMHLSPLQHSAKHTKRPTKTDEAATAIPGHSYQLSKLFSDRALPKSWQHKYTSSTTA